MKIIIVGCGKVGTSIANELDSEGHQLRLIDTNKSAVIRLSDSIDAMGIVGNGAIYDTLAEAEVSSADLVIAATARDEVNLYTCLMAKNSGAKNTIARVRNPEYKNDLFRVKDAMGLSMSINPELTAALEVSRLLRYSGALEIDSFSKGAAELIKVCVPEGSVLVNKAISRIDILSGKVRICMVERGSEVYIPNGDCMDQELLFSEGIEHADGVVALMDYDEENILISMYIKNVSKAKIITKVNNSTFDNIIDQLKLESVINPKGVAGEYIARYIRAMQNSMGSNVETLYRLSDDRVEALEFRAKSTTKVAAIPFAELNLKNDLQVICISRRGKVILPTGRDYIMPDDRVVVVTKHKGLSDLDDIVSRR